MKVVLILLAGIAAFYYYIFRNWDYKKKLVFKMVLTYISLFFMVVGLIMLFGSIRDAYEEEKGRTLTERLARTESYVRRADYSGLADLMKLYHDFEPEFEYLWERIEMNEYYHRYLIFSAAERNGRNGGDYAEYTLKYEKKLLSLCLSPDYEENIPYGEYYLKQAGISQ